MGNEDVVNLRLLLKQLAERESWLETDERCPLCQWGGKETHRSDCPFVLAREIKPEGYASPVVDEMMEKFSKCPQCGSEYLKEVEYCSDCNYHLEEVRTRNRAAPSTSIQSTAKTLEAMKCQKSVNVRDVRLTVPIKFLVNKEVREAFAAGAEAMHTELAATPIETPSATFITTVKLAIEIVNQSINGDDAIAKLESLLPERKEDQ